MLNGTPPPLCRADRVAYELSAQGATQGLLIRLGVSSDRTCRLPQRPAVQILVDGRAAPTVHRVFTLGSESRPRTTIRRGTSAYSFLRWQNWCGGTGAISLRITLGRRTVVRALPAASTPTCTSRGVRSTLGVSLFVRQ